MRLAAVQGEEASSGSYFRRGLRVRATLLPRYNQPPLTAATYHLREPVKKKKKKCGKFHIWSDPPPYDRNCGKFSKKKKLKKVLKTLKSPK